MRAVSKVFLKFWSAADKQRPALPITRSRAEGCRRAAIPATGGRAHPPAKRACYRSRPASWPRSDERGDATAQRRCSSFLSIISRPPRATVSALKSLDRPGVIFVAVNYRSKIFSECCYAVTRHLCRRSLATRDALLSQCLCSCDAVTPSGHSWHRNNKRAAQGRTVGPQTRFFSR